MNIAEIQRSMAKQAKQVQELEQQVKELERKNFFRYASRQETALSCKYCGNSSQDGKTRKELAQQVQELDGLDS